MKKIFYAVPVIAGIILVSCKDKNDEQQNTNTTPVTAPAQFSDPNVQQTPVNSQPVDVSTPVTTTPTKTAPGMNPPHGEPGHRCDIAVGMPLSTPQANQPAITPTVTQPTAPSQQTVNIPAPTTTAAKVAPGINPAHGEPGHRCDIAVGQPLNTPPPAATKPANNGSSTQLSVTPEVKKQ